MISFRHFFPLSLQVLQRGAKDSPTKPKGRPKKESPDDEEDVEDDEMDSDIEVDDDEDDDNNTNNSNNNNIYNSLGDDQHFNQLGIRETALRSEITLPDFGSNVKAVQPDDLDPRSPTSASHYDKDGEIGAPSMSSTTSRPESLQETNLSICS